MKKLYLMLAAFLLHGCDKPAVDIDSALTPTKVAALENRTLALERRVADLEGRHKAESQNSSILQRSDDGFSFFTTDMGTLTARLISITRDGTGSKVTLQIGNPTAATITKLTLVGAWGGLDKDGAPAGEEHVFQAAISQNIPSGTWGRASFIIEGGKADEIGFIRIGSGVVGAMRLNNAT